MSTQVAPGLLDRGVLLTSDELADYLQVPIGTLEQWASRGGEPEYHKVGKHRRYDPAAVRKWLAEQRRATAS